MAFDQISLFLYPPRWQRQSESSPNMRYAFTGEPVQLVSAAPVADSDAPPIPLGDVRRWLSSRGFEPIVDDPHHVIFATATIPSALGQRPEIEISADTESGEVACFYCRFLLSRNTPLRLERWEAIFRDLCGVFSLRIGLRDGESAGPEEFLMIVRSQDNWRCFAENFGWENERDEDQG